MQTKKTLSLLPSVQDCKTSSFIKKQLSSLLKYLTRLGISNDDMGVVEHHDQLQYIIQAIYTFLYDRKNSHHTLQDIKIFVSYLGERIKGIKNIVDTICMKK